MLPTGQLLGIDSILSAKQPIHVLAGLKEKKVNQRNFSKDIPYLGLLIQVLANLFDVFG
jgi:hypothetical protein